MRIESLYKLLLLLLFFFFFFQMRLWFKVKDVHDRNSASKYARHLHRNKKKNEIIELRRRTEREKKYEGKNDDGRRQRKTTMNFREMNNYLSSISSLYVRHDDVVPMINTSLSTMDVSTIPIENIDLELVVQMILLLNIVLLVECILNKKIILIITHRKRVKSYVLFNEVMLVSFLSHRHDYNPHENHYS